MAGILLGFWLSLPATVVWPWALLLLPVFIFSFVRAGKLFLQDLFFGMSVLAIFLYFGILAATLNLPHNKPAHYINHLPENTKSPSLIIAQVTEKLKPGAFQDKYILQAQELNGNFVTGKILLNITRDTEIYNLEVGEKMVLAGDLKNINTPLNPYQFNYSEYMENLGVLRQLNLRPQELMLLGNSSTNLRSLAGDLREKIIKALKAKDFEADELAIIQALLLGQRQEISQEIYSNYAAAGVIHILAVSGLHVGIILLLLNRVLQPLERIRGGKVVKTLLLLFLLWGFAVLAGLSPSVVRAVSMFSFVAIGMQLNRRTSVLNTLFMSLLVLLLVNPGYITQVGFQLSYAAVISIVLIQPPLYNLYTGDSRFIKYFWGIFTVTLAAQAGVFPLSLFYFHQFPGLFLLSNLVILPFLGIILGLGIFVMILGLLNLLPVFLAEIFGAIISALNSFVAWTASKEDFIFQNIGFSLLLCIFSYFIVVAFIYMLKNFSYRSMVFFLIAIIVFQSVFIYERSSAEITESLVFHKSRNTVIGTRKANTLTLFHDLEAPAASYSFVKDYNTHQNLEHLRENPLKNVYSISGQSVLQIDSSGIYQIPNFKPEIILLSSSPRINLDRVLEFHSPKMIIADGSNYPSAVQRWKETAKNKKLPFHATAEKGAYLFKPSE